MVNQEEDTAKEIELPITFEQAPLDVELSNVMDEDVMQQQSEIEDPIPFDHAPLDWRNMRDQILQRQSDIKVSITNERGPLDIDWPIFTDDATEDPFDPAPLDADWSDFKGDETEATVTYDAGPLDADWSNIKDDETEVHVPYETGPLDVDWSNFMDSDIRQQQSAILAAEAEKIPFVGDKEPLSSLEAEYQSGSPILLEKIKVLSEQFDGIRRVRGDGNCFFRAFMFSYLEHILVSQDGAEVVRIKEKVEECRNTLRCLGHPELTFEDYFELFLEQLDGVLQGNDAPISFDDLVARSRDKTISDFIVMFFRFITSGEIRKRSEFFEPFVLGMTNGTVEQFCKASVEPMGEESDHVHITALSDTLGVAIRVEYLDQSIGYDRNGGGITVNHHDFIPNGNDDGASPPPPPAEVEHQKPFVTLLYRPGHYDVLYYKN
ncbi:OVARIAN TUMOR DOMAIN-containing deubiquitinating enzyme 1-like [Impatiens glandulifera]|uniref:OVARIAN TUMOR DOMAIN-containing deubiquitinating enzyme 1-like n=1 Tax=Impatiens glandulifera TaxID=253017 RepID=UPI001FB1279B|nr:OVARIAN TUMOR DOMAIN-containing deubiquitinating enzyme 1-like [Impatiens glandulifera]